MSMMMTMIIIMIIKHKALVLIPRRTIAGTQQANVKSAGSIVRHIYKQENMVPSRSKPSICPASFFGLYCSTWQSWLLQVKIELVCRIYRTFPAVHPSTLRMTKRHLNSNFVQRIEVMQLVLSHSWPHRQFDNFKVRSCKSQEENKGINFSGEARDECEQSRFSFCIRKCWCS